MLIVHARKELDEEQFQFVQIHLRQHQLQVMHHQLHVMQQ
jgi:hypothetical protein